MEKSIEHDMDIGYMQGFAWNIINIIVLDGL